ncbi:MAG: M20/M25/M40 family metallo-hydrolase [Clostridia bacterium]|nr:M20/M25/M40 family metallo-hydrolase [Clostridia bacterium]
MKKELLDLSALGGISGFESAVGPKVRALLELFCDSVTEDRFGNLIGIRPCGKKNAKKVMIEAHIDGIGLMVKDIDERGFITFTNIGGVDTRILPAQEVIVCGKKELFGVIGAKPPHLLSPDEADKPAKMSDMAIDVGLSAEEVRKLVTPGDMITFAGGAKELGKKVISGKYLDDRAGLVSLLLCLKELEKKTLDFDVVVLAAAQEEVGCRGARVGAEHIAPDVALVVDVCHGNTEDGGTDSIFKLGEGTVLSLGPNIHPYLSFLAQDVADKQKIKYKLDVDGGDTGTDAWEIQVAAEGIPTMLLSIPLRYMHTTVETLSYDDVVATGKLLAAVIENLDLEVLSCYYQI